MRAEAYHVFSLTVAEGKRLLAKGVAAMPCVREAMADGVVIVTRSTTSGYVLEELLGRPIDRCSFVTGRTLPSGHADRAKMLSADLPEMVLRGGEVDEGAVASDLVGELEPGDVIIKSPNALDHARGVVGYLIGAATGGTVGTYLGPSHGRHLHFVAPCGLEKQVTGDLTAAASRLTEGGARIDGPSLWVTPAEICTELEAIELLTGAEAMQVAAGGVMGAEGAAWIAAMGSKEQIAQVRRLIGEVEGEPEMLEYAEGSQG